MPDAGDWRAFASGHYRAFHAVSVGQGAVAALAGGAVTTPLLLQLGAAPALAMAVGILPALGSLTQLALPAVLRRADGNLRRVSFFVAAIGDTRGFWFAAIVAATAAGLLAPSTAIGLIVLVSVAAATLGGLSATTTMAWFHAVLPEAERRLVAPRLGAVGALVGVAMLLPTVALLADGRAGLWAYVVPLLAAALASVAGLVGLSRLPRPGRVRVPVRQHVRADRPVSLQRYLGTSAVGAVGFGISPPLSIYAIAVLGLSPGFAVTLSVVGTLASLVASALVASMLARGSASRLIRSSYLVRIIGAALGIAALGVPDLAPALLLTTVGLGSAGDAMGSLAGTERLLRLAVGPGAIADQADYVATTSLASAGGQVTAAAVLAVGQSMGALPYAVLFVASGAARLVAATRMDVTPPARRRVVGEPGFEPGTSRI